MALAAERASEELRGKHMAWHEVMQRLGDIDQESRTGMAAKFGMLGRLTAEISGISKGYDEHGRLSDEEQKRMRERIKSATTIKESLEKEVAAHIKDPDFLYRLRGGLGKGADIIADGRSIIERVDEGELRARKSALIERGHEIEAGLASKRLDPADRETSSIMEAAETLLGWRLVKAGREPAKLVKEGERSVAMPKSTLGEGLFHRVIRKELHSTTDEYTAMRRCRPDELETLMRAKALEEMDLPMERKKYPNADQILESLKNPKLMEALR